MGEFGASHLVSRIVGSKLCRGVGLRTRPSATCQVSYPGVTCQVSYPGVILVGDHPIQPNNSLWDQTPGRSSVTPQSAYYRLLPPAQIIQYNPTTVSGIKLKTAVLSSNTTQQQSLESNLRPQFCDSTISRLQASSTFSSRTDHPIQPNNSLWDQTSSNTTQQQSLGSNLRPQFCDSTISRLQAPSILSSHTDHPIQPNNSLWDQKPGRSSVTPQSPDYRLLPLSPPAQIIQYNPTTVSGIRRQAAVLSSNTTQQQSLGSDARPQFCDSTICRLQAPSSRTDHPIQPNNSPWDQTPGRSSVTPQSPDYRPLPFSPPAQIIQYNPTTVSGIRRKAVVLSSNTTQQQSLGSDARPQFCDSTISRLQASSTLSSRRDHPIQPNNSLWDQTPGRSSVTPQSPDYRLLPFSPPTQIIQYNPTTVSGIKRQAVVLLQAPSSRTDHPIQPNNSLWDQTQGRSSVTPQSAYYRLLPPAQIIQYNPTTVSGIRRQAVVLSSNTTQQQSLGSNLRPQFCDFTISSLQAPSILSSHTDHPIQPNNSLWDQTPGRSSVTPQSPDYRLLPFSPPTQIIQYNPTTVSGIKRQAVVLLQAPSTLSSRTDHPIQPNNSLWDQTPGRSSVTPQSPDYRTLPLSPPAQIIQYNPTTVSGIRRQAAVLSSNTTQQQSLGSNARPQLCDSTISGLQAPSSHTDHPIQPNNSPWDQTPGRSSVTPQSPDYRPLPFSPPAQIIQYNPTTVSGIKRQAVVLSSNTTQQQSLGSDARPQFCDSTISRLQASSTLSSRTDHPIQPNNSLWDHKPGRSSVTPQSPDYRLLPLSPPAQIIQYNPTTVSGIRRQAVVLSSNTTQQQSLGSNLRPQFCDSTISRLQAPSILSSHTDHPIQPNNSLWDQTPGRSSVTPQSPDYRLLPLSPPTQIIQYNPTTVSGIRRQAAVLSSNTTQQQSLGSDARPQFCDSTISRLQAPSSRTDHPIQPNNSLWDQTPGRSSVTPQSPDYRPLPFSPPAQIIQYNPTTVSGIRRQAVVLLQASSILSSRTDHPIQPNNSLWDQTPGRSSVTPQSPDYRPLPLFPPAEIIQYNPTTVSGIKRQAVVLLQAPSSRTDHPIQSNNSLWDQTPGRSSVTPQSPDYRLLPPAQIIQYNPTTVSGIRRQAVAPSSRTDHPIQPNNSLWDQTPGRSSVTPQSPDYRLLPPAQIIQYNPTTVSGIQTPGRSSVTPQSPDYRPLPFSPPAQIIQYNPTTVSGIKLKTAVLLQAPSILSSHTDHPIQPNNSLWDQTPGRSSVTPQSPDYRPLPFFPPAQIIQYNPTTVSGIRRQAVVLSSNTTQQQSLGSDARPQFCDSTISGLQDSSTLSSRTDHPIQPNNSLWDQTPGRSSVTPQSPDYRLLPPAQIIQYNPTTVSGIRRQAAVLSSNTTQQQSLGSDARPQFCDSTISGLQASSTLSSRTDHPIQPNNSLWDQTPGRSSVTPQSPDYRLLPFSPPAQIIQYNPTTVSGIRLQDITGLFHSLLPHRSSNTTQQQSLGSDARPQFCDSTIPRLQASSILSSRTDHPIQPNNSLWDQTPGRSSVTPQSPDYRLLPFSPPTQIIQYNPTTVSGIRRQAVVLSSNTTQQQSLGSDARPQFCDSTISRLQAPSSRTDHPIQPNNSLWDQTPGRSSVTPQSPDYRLLPPAQIIQYNPTTVSGIKRQAVVLSSNTTQQQSLGSDARPQFCDSTISGLQAPSTLSSRTDHPIQPNNSLWDQTPGRSSVTPQYPDYRLLPPAQIIQYNPTTVSGIRRQAVVLLQAPSTLSSRTDHPIQPNNSLWDQTPGRSSVTPQSPDYRPLPFFPPAQIIQYNPTTVSGIRRQAVVLSSNTTQQQSLGSDARPQFCDSTISRLQAPSSRTDHPIQPNNSLWDQTPGRSSVTPQSPDYRLLPPAQIIQYNPTTVSGIRRQAAVLSSNTTQQQSLGSDARPQFCDSTISRLQAPSSRTDHPIQPNNSLWDQTPGRSSVTPQSPDYRPLPFFPPAQIIQYNPTTVSGIRRQAVVLLQAPSSRTNHPIQPNNSLWDQTPGRSSVTPQSPDYRPLPFFPPAQIIQYNPTTVSGIRRQAAVLSSNTTQQQSLGSDARPQFCDSTISGLQAPSSRTDHPIQPNNSLWDQTPGRSSVTPQSPDYRTLPLFPPAQIIQYNPTTVSGIRRQAAVLSSNTTQQQSLGSDARPQFCDSTISRLQAPSSRTDHPIQPNNSLWDQTPGRSSVTPQSPDYRTLPFFPPAQIIQYNPTTVSGIKCQAAVV
ncbi:hypothetical protein RRG08_063742 [Elysia crispata]|uniref:Uncharacterized protein n=1 Tax=Elysia crispata TaxID=231223 RepID=A0AAE0Y933_9GAST|nr:hypothetical protein RRG08_063742 [Elysia crispata]